MAGKKRTGAFVRGRVTGGIISSILRERGQKAVEMAGAEVKKQAEIIRDDAKSRCPVDTGKLAESIKVVEYNGGLYCRISADARNRTDILSIANIFRANIIDVQKDSLIIELTGSQPKLKAMLDMLDGYQIAELARTGITGLSRGLADVRYL